MARKQFNPTEYKQDFMNLATTAPQEAADVAMKWRERFMNQAETMKKSHETLATIGLAGLSSFGVAWFDGGWEAKRDAMIRDWQEDGHVEAEADLEEHPTPFSHSEGGSDPTKLFGVVDKTLVWTLFLAGLAAFNVFGKKYTPLVQAAALGSGAYWAGSIGRNLGYGRVEKKLAAAAEEEGQAAA